MKDYEISIDNGVKEIQESNKAISNKTIEVMGKLTSSPNITVNISTTSHSDKLIFFDNENVTTGEGTNFIMNIRTFEFFMRANELTTKKQGEQVCLFKNGVQYGNIIINDQDVKEYITEKYL